MRCKITLASGMEGTLTLREGTSRLSAPARATAPAREPDKVADIVRAALGGRISQHEVVCVLSVNGRGNLIALHEVSIGSLMSSVIHPREVFRRAIADNAAAIILAHNHPSNDPTPSVEDHQVTSRLAEAGQLLGIRLLDHVVVAADSFRSFHSEGWLQ